MWHYVLERFRFQSVCGVFGLATKTRRSMVVEHCSHTERVGFLWRDILMLLEQHQYSAWSMSESVVEFLLVIIVVMFRKSA
jgi:hypothetical protein